MHMNFFPGHLILLALPLLLMSGTSGRGAEPRSLAERQRRQEAEQEIVRVGRQGVLPLGVLEQFRKPAPHPVGLGEGPLPLVIHQCRRVVPRLHLAVPGAVGPGLVRVAGEEEPFRHPEGGVVRRQEVR